MNTDDVAICYTCTNLLLDTQNRIICILCKHTYHLNCYSSDLTDSSNLESWYCLDCLANLLPFNCISDVEMQSQFTNDCPAAFVAPQEKLKLYNDDEAHRPLANNCDLDPDDNYYVNRPVDHGYMTPSQLALVMKEETHMCSLMHINCRSIASKLIDIQLLLHEIPSHVLAVSETWLDQTLDSTVHIQGYTFIHKPRETGGGGGVGFFIKHNIDYQIMPQQHPNHTSYESLFIRISQLNCPPSVLGVVYRAPGQPVQQFNEEFDQLLSDLTASKRDIFLMGDFNIDLLKHNEHGPTNTFLNTVTSHYFLPTILRPTRITDTTRTLIDNIFTNIWPKTINSALITDAISDHLPVITWFSSHMGKLDKPANYRTRIFNDQSKDLFKTLLQQIDFSSVLLLCNDNEPNIAYDTFLNLIKGAYNKAFPLIQLNKKNRHSFKNPWMTKGLLKSCNKKNKLYQLYIKNPTKTNKDKFTVYRNKFKTIKNKMIQTFYALEFAKYSKDIRKTWSIIKTLVNSKTSDTKIQSLSINDVSITDNTDIAETLNNYFTGIAKNLSSKIPATINTFMNYMKPSPPNSFVANPTTPQELLEINSLLKTTHSPGPDLLDPSIISPNLSLITTPLVDIINCSLSTGIVPEGMKMSTVTPIFKQGTKTDPSNYRPISVLPFFSKLLEKVMYQRLENYVTKMNILYPYQHGFRSGHSTYMSVLNVQDKITQAIDKNEYSIGIFLDLSKAFDTVDHSILIGKLEKYGIRGIPLSWFKDYLSNRKQQVKCNETLSSFKAINFGVPQGSILGPLLFLIYINDLPNVSSILHFILFADDSNVFISHKSYENVHQLLNNELVSVSDWFKANKLSLNLNKTNYIVFSSHRKPVQHQKGTVLIDNTVIPEVTSVKFLGVFIDQHITWNDHINHISLKIAKNVGIISRLAYLLPTNILLTLYYSLIYPYLAYCNMIWATNYISRLHRVIILQKRIVRIILGLPYNSHSDQAFAQLGILKIHQIRLVQICEFMHRYTHKSLPKSYDNYFSLASDFHSYLTRGSRFYRSEYARTNTRQLTVKLAGPALWNVLPQDLRVITNRYQFKKQLKRWIIDNK